GLCIGDVCGMVAHLIFTPRRGSGPARSLADLEQLQGRLYAARSFANLGDPVCRERYQRDRLPSIIAELDFVGGPWIVENGDDRSYVSRGEPFLRHCFKQSDDIEFVDP